MQKKIHRKQIHARYLDEGIQKKNNDAIKIGKINLLNSNPFMKLPKTCQQTRQKNCRGLTDLYL